MGGFLPPLFRAPTLQPVWELQITNIQQPQRHGCGSARPLDWDEDRSCREISQSIDVDGMGLSCLAVMERRSWTLKHGAIKPRMELCSKSWEDLRRVPAESGRSADQPNFVHWVSCTYNSWNMDACAGPIELGSGCRVRLAPARLRLEEGT